MNNSFLATTNRTLWDDKRYYSFNYYLKTRFGEKVYKLSLNAGLSCPNRDGTLGTGGCIFCSEGGSGDFTPPSVLPITEQINKAKQLFIPSILGGSHIKKTKQIGSKYIAYFQAFTNTYGPIDYLRQIFHEAITHPDIVALSIATRPDCLGPDILKLLSELNQIKPVWVELGLQTIHEETTSFIRRAYPLSTFQEAVDQLHSIGIDIIVHIIIGLPGETKKNLLETIEYLGRLPIQGVKLQLLHILKNTDLEPYLNHLSVLTKDEYLDLLICCIERLPASIVIHRVTGDGPRNLLLAPLWSTDKKGVLNSLHKKMKEKDTWQGKFYI